MTWDEARSLAESYGYADVYIIHTDSLSLQVSEGWISMVTPDYIIINHGFAHEMITRTSVIQSIIPKENVCLDSFDGAFVEIEYTTTINRYKKAQGKVRGNTVIIEGDPTEVIFQHQLISVHRLPCTVNDMYNTIIRSKL